MSLVRSAMDAEKAVLAKLCIVGDELVKFGCRLIESSKLTTAQHSWAYGFSTVFFDISQGSRYVGEITMDFDYNRKLYRLYFGTLSEGGSKPDYELIRRVWGNRTPPSNYMMIETKSRTEFLFAVSNLSMRLHSVVPGYKIKIVHMDGPILDVHEWNF